MSYVQWLILLLRICQKRLRIVDVKMHYVPKRNKSDFVTHDGIDAATEDEEWQAFVVKPDVNFELSEGPLHVPTLVLNLAVRQKITLQLATYTLESTVAIIEFYKESLRTDINS